MPDINSELEVMEILDAAMESLPIAKAQVKQYGAAWYAISRAMGAIQNAIEAYGNEE